MHISRRRIRSMAVLSATAMCATLPAISAAHAAPTTGPTLSATVNGVPMNSRAIMSASGVMDVTATITAVPGQPVTQIGYYFAASLLGGTTTLAPGSCTSTCTVHLSVDTSALTPYNAAGVEIPAVNDGLHTFGLYVNTPPMSASQTMWVNVDNQRPTVTAPSGQSFVVRAAKQFTWTVKPSAATAPGTTITGVEFGLDAPGLPAIPFTENPDGSWTVTADTSSLAPGAYDIVAVATDSKGTLSRPLDVRLLVDTGFALTTNPAIGITPDLHGLKLGYSYPGNWVACGPVNGYYLAPTDIQLRVDGQNWQDFPVGQAWWNTPGSSQCAVPVIGNSAVSVKPLPLGTHTLTYVVTDSNGVQESTSQTVTVGDALTSTWPSGQVTLGAGSTLNLKPTITSPDGSSTLKSWTITDQNLDVLASGTGATPPSLTFPTSAKQETNGLLDLNLVSNLGIASGQSFTYQTGWPTAAFAHLSATSIAKGSWVDLSADIWQRTAGAWVHDPRQTGTVQWQWSTPGSNVWHTGTTVLTSINAPRPAAIWTRPGGSACYRVVYSEPSDVIPGISAPVCVMVKP